MTVLILDARVIYDLALNRKHTRERVEKIINWLSDDYELKVSSLVKNHLKDLLGDDESHKIISVFSAFFFDIDSELLNIIKEITLDDIYSTVEAAYAQRCGDAFIVTTCPDSFIGSGAYVCGDSHLESLLKKLELEKAFLLGLKEPYRKMQSLVDVGVSTDQCNKPNFQESIQFNHVRVISTRIPLLTTEKRIDLLTDWGSNKQSKYACVANVHMVMEANENKPFSQVLQNADIIVPDGLPLVWMMKLLGAKEQNSVSRLNLLQSLCHKASEENIKVFFLGSQQLILDRMRSRLEQDYPNLNIVGMKPLPFRPLTPNEDLELIEEIHESAAGLVFLCLGCPKQEEWMAEHKGRIKAVMIGLNSTFSEYAGLKKWTPHWVRQTSFEWIYHFVLSRKSLFYPYSGAILSFIVLVFSHLFSESTTDQTSE